LGSIREYRSILMAQAKAMAHAQGMTSKHLVIVDTVSEALLGVISLRQPGAYLHEWNNPCI
jgi:hypothetical protein